MTAAVLAGLGAAAGADVLAVGSDLAGLGAVDIRDALLDLAPVWLDSALSLATGVAYDMYDSARLRAGHSDGFDFIIRDVPSRDVGALAGWAARPAFEVPDEVPDWVVADVLDRAEQAVADEAVSACREAQVLTGARDKAVRGFARHARSNACDFCKMLATRGGAYHSRASAGDSGAGWNRFHSSCHCVVQPVYK